MLGVGAEVFVLFLAVGPGRRQVFNEYFHSCPRFGGTALQRVVWSAAGGRREVGREESGVGRRRSCGERRREGLGWGGPDLGCRMGAHGAEPGRVITGRRCARCEPGQTQHNRGGCETSRGGADMGEGLGRSLVVCGISEV